MSNSFTLRTSEDSYQIRSKAAGPAGSLPLTKDMLLNSPSGDLFGFSQNVGMGWDPKFLNGGQVLILSTLGGMRKEDGTPIALGYHTGHWELGLLVREAAEELKDNGKIPFAAYCSDPCDGRSQGTDGMMDSLAYRNTAHEAFSRLIRSLPTRRSVMGIATCDKGLPAMMMALAEALELPTILVPGGVTLPPEDGEDAGTVQSLGTRFAHGEVTLEEAADLSCRACASPGGGCQFLGTAASSQVVAEALGLALPHSALIPSGERVWFELARESARALLNLEERKIFTKHIITEGSVRNAMAVHAAFGGSTNLLLHVPAIAHSAGVRRPTVKDWAELNKAIPRLVDVLPNGPVHHKTVQVFLAGAVPEVMLHLRELGVLDLSAMTVTGQSLGENLRWWEESERRTRFKEILLKQDGVATDDVIMSPAVARSRGLSSTVLFPEGNLAPEGSVVKCTAIDNELCPGNVYTHRGPVRVFCSEEAAIAAIKGTSGNPVQAGDIIVLLCRGPLGAGMPETSQITMALKYTKALKHIALLTDGRFSGFSSGPCIGHIGPEALANGPVGKLHDGDIVDIVIDRNNLQGSINLVGVQAGDQTQRSFSPEIGQEILNSRKLREDLKPAAGLPGATRLWAALQSVSGGTWGGCVYDVDEILSHLLKSSEQVN